MENAQRAIEWMNFVLNSFDLDEKKRQFEIYNITFNYLRYEELKKNADTIKNIFIHDQELIRQLQNWTPRNKVLRHLHSMDIALRIILSSNMVIKECIRISRDCERFNRECLAILYITTYKTF